MGWPKGTKTGIRSWRRLPDKIELAVAADYAAHVPVKDIAKRYSICGNTARHIAQRLGVTIPPPGGKRRYALNQEAFSVLTDDAKYWMGFILADGCVYRKKYTNDLRVTLAATDGLHLKSLQAFLGSTRPLQETESVCSLNGAVTKAIALSVSSRRLTDDLIRYGITPRKTHTATVHPELTDSPRFWAGVIDGDGSLELRCNPRSRQYIKRPVMSLVGTHAVCEAFAAFTRSRFPDYDGKPRPHKMIWKIRVGGFRAAKLAEEMYATGPALPRKRSLAKAFVQSFIDHPTPETFDWNSVTRESLIEGFERLGSWRLVADEIGTTFCALGQQLTARFTIERSGSEEVYKHCEVVTLLGTTRATVTMWQRRGGIIPGAVHGTSSRVLGYSKSVVDDWIAAGAPEFTNRFKS